MPAEPDWATLEAALSGELHLDDEARRACSADASPAEPCLPLGVVVARDEADVAATMAWSAQNGVPVVPRGGGTGKAGGCVPSPGSVVLLLTGLASLGEVRVADGWVEAGAGVITRSLKEAVEGERLFYPPDPGGLDHCTIGGNAATNAGGPSTLKYGVTGDYVLGLRAVLPDGRVVETGRRQPKGVAGYDLVSLLVGSEGTLAVITELRLRLVPQPREARAALLPFATVAAAAAAVVEARKVGLWPRALELFDGATLRRAGRDPAFPSQPGWGALLIAEFDGPPGQPERDLRALAQAAPIAPLEVRVAASEQERQDLWAIRRQTSRLVKVGTEGWVSEDIAVPLGSLPAMLERLGDIGEAHDLTVLAYGHAGDGNLHVNVLWDEPSGAERADGAVAAVLEAALDLGGTITGEHGVGTLKRPFLGREVGDDVLGLMGAIKRTWDPRGLLNPGKVLAG
jgi:glycolate oxidase